MNKKFLLLALLFLSGNGLIQASSTFEPVNGFDSPANYPGTALVSDGAGHFWGTSLQGGGGAFGHDGTVYEVDAGTGEVTTMFKFENEVSGSSPGPLFYDGAGYVWGVTTYGGSGGAGTIFKMNVTTDVLTTVVSFDDVTIRGSAPESRLTSDGSGYIWGTTSTGGSGDAGTIFKLDPATGALTTMLEFNSDTQGSQPQVLISDGAGKFWGTTGVGIVGSDGQTRAAGSIFVFNPSNGNLTTIAQFDGIAVLGSNPNGELTDDGAGNFWGTTGAGGHDGYGTIFKVNKTTRAPTTVYQFTSAATLFGPTGLVDDGNGYFWGGVGGGSASDGAIFKISKTGNSPVTVLQFDDSSIKGRVPAVSLVGDQSGSLWGTTLYGGANDGGTIFKVAVGTGALTTMANLSHGVMGIVPHGLISDGAGFIWGVNEHGGAHNSGTVFKVEESTGTVSKVTDFDSSTKLYNPGTALVSAGAGNFLGTTYAGGANSEGCVFRIDGATGALTTIGNFEKLEVYENIRASALVADGTGNFWGTSTYGGTSEAGSIFKFDTGAGTLTTVVDFQEKWKSIGGNPDGALLYDGAGYLWGTNSAGASKLFGTVFKIEVSTGILTTVAVLGAKTGVGTPTGALVDAGSGWLWGLAWYDLENANPVVYKVSKVSGAVVRVADLPGAEPVGPLVSDGAGHLFGVMRYNGIKATGGFAGDGLIFRVDTANGSVATLLKFTGTSGKFPGRFPSAGLAMGSDGNLYGSTEGDGVTSGGRPAGGGQLFRIRLSNNGDPVANDDVFSYLAKPTGPVSLDVLANDTPAQGGDTLTVVDFTQPTSGTVTIENSGTSLSYTPASTGTPALDSFAYTISDGHGGTATGVVVLRNTYVNLSGSFQAVAASGQPTKDFTAVVTLAKTDTFTLTLNLGGGTYKAKGTPGTPLTIPRKAPLSNLTVTVTINAGTNQAEITVDDGSGAVTASFAAQLAFPKTSPAPQAGTYTMILPAPTQITLETATAQGTVAGGKISGISVSDGGAGYISTPKVTITDSTGKGAAATAVVDNGQITSITVTKPGSGYTAATVTIDPPSGLPQGYGYATATVSTSGAVTVAGKLGDGTAFTGGSALVASGSANAFTFYAKASSPTAPHLYGTLTFEDRFHISDFDGVLYWNLPVQKKPGRFDKGFAFYFNAVGSTYQAPAKGGFPLDWSVPPDNAKVLLTGGGLASDLHKFLNVDLAPSSKVTPDDTSAGSDVFTFKMTLTDKTGIFSGSFAPPGAKTSTKFSGALFQKQNLGAGVFTDTSQSGAIGLYPQ